jgi:predicted DCC family thiol-disulfide oxidoreductase YuxK
MIKQLAYPAVIIFDGFCNLCDKSVSFILKHDREKRFFFIALQSEAGVFLRQKYAIPPETDSVILWQEGKFFFHSEAAMLIGRQLKCPGLLVNLFRIFPLKVRDKVYQWIAANRYKWFGERAVCRIPSADEFSRFLSKDDLQLILARIEDADIN